MAVPAWIVEQWEKLSLENRAQAGDYIEHLLRQQRQKADIPVRKLGLLTDRFEFIAEDFDAPIDDFREYM